MKQDVYEVISYNIKKYRIKKKLTQKELAQITNFSPEFIRRIESTKGKKYFSIYTIFIIANAINIPISLLFEDKKD